MLIENVKKKCAERGISVHKLEKEVKLGNGTISGWNKSAPRIDTVKRISDYFGCSIEELLEE